MIQLTNRDFKTRVLESDLPVLIGFWAPWCGPCQAMAPVLDSLACEYAGRIVVAGCNVDASPRISIRYGIQSIPTLILFKNGIPAEKIIGLVPTGQIKSALNKVLDDVGSSASLMTV